MADFLTLLKIDFLSLFGLNKALHSKDKNVKNKLIGIMAVAALLCLGAVGMSVMYSIMFADIFTQMGESLEKLPALMFSLAGIFVLFSTVYSANGTLFGMKDYECLSALPIKPYIIVLSKLTFIYIVNGLLFALLLIPSAVVYGVYEGADVWFYLRMLINLPFAPMLPLVVSILIGTLVSYLGSRFRKSNIINTVLSLLLLMAYFALIFSQNFGDNTAIFNIAQSLYKIYPLNGVFVSGVVRGNLFIYLLLIVGSAAVFALFTYVFGRLFKALNNAMMAKVSKANFKMTSQRGDSLFVALFKREWKRYFASNIYVMNTIIGPIMLILFSVILGSQLGKVDMTEVSAAINVQALIGAIIPLFPVFFIGLCNTCACSISIEGKNLWILKSSPVDEREILRCKLLLNRCLNIPAVIVSSIVLTIFLHLAVQDVILMLVIGISYSLVSSQIGLLFNLRFPVFDWENEMQIVKRGMSMGLAILVGMLTVLPFLVIEVVCVMFGLNYLGTIFAAVCFVVLAIILHKVIYGYGIRRFKQL